VENSSKVEENLKRLERFLLPLEVVPLDAGAGRQYGCVRTELKRAGWRIGPNDLLIAAHALALGATIVTNNVREFFRITGLGVEHWG
jgi:tRNA(fMet)-specific endonuclease VapC